MRAQLCVKASRFIQREGGMEWGRRGFLSVTNNYGGGGGGDDDDDDDDDDDEGGGGGGDDYDDNDDGNGNRTTLRVTLPEFHGVDPLLQQRTGWHSLL